MRAICHRCLGQLFDSSDRCVRCGRQSSARRRERMRNGIVRERVIACLNAIIEGGTAENEAVLRAEAVAICEEKP